MVDYSIIFPHYLQNLVFYSVEEIKIDPCQIGAYPESRRINPRIQKKHEDWSAKGCS